MPRISEIIATIEELAPLSLQEVWDNCGVQVGYNLDAECSGALLCLDVTLESVELAIESGLNLLISHHPLTIEGVRNFTNSSEVGRIIQRAIASGITIYSAHTSLDSCSGGLNDFLASALSLSSIEVLEPAPTCPEVGLGRIGTLVEECSAEELAQRVKSVLSAPAVKFSDGGRAIRRVALCSGSGGSLIPRVKALGVDAYICSDLKYHNFADMAVSGITLVDVGHFESEICAIDIFESEISKKFPTFALLKHPLNCIKHL